MLNKEADELYCGVREEIIRSANPTLDINVLKTLQHFIVERYNVHIKKDVLGLEKPWTEDSIIANYRFTNVRREHDKETRWLLDNISNNKNFSYRDRLLNTLLYRIYNKHETAIALDMPIRFDEYDVGEKCNKIKNGYKLFNSAFMVSGMKAGLAVYVPKGVESTTDQRPLWLLEELNNKFFDDIQNCVNQEDCFNVLKNINGFSDFMAYQVFVDFTYMDDFPFSENEFVKLGPGATCGLDFLFEDKDGMTNEECIFWLRDNFDRLMNDIGENNPAIGFSDIREEDRVMNVMSLENCFCELSKYIKISQGKGRRRSYGK